MTRMNNGWILIVGGQDSSGNLNNTALVYKPETATNATRSNGVFEQISIGRGRALHSATRLANGQVLVTGGLAPVEFNPGLQEYTRLAQVFSLTPGILAGFTVTSIENLLSEARAEHAAPIAETGTVFVIGGRNQAVGSDGIPLAGLNFLDSVEFFPFSNTLPVVTRPNTHLSTPGNNRPIEFDVTDAEGDSAYVIVRYRLPGEGVYRNANITSQSINGGAFTSPATLMVVPGSVTLIWDTTGIPSGISLTVQITPVGAVIGTPIQFMSFIP
jgi:hypothetical protein